MTLVETGLNEVLVDVDLNFSAVRISGESSLLATV